MVLFRNEIFVLKKNSLFSSERLPSIYVQCVSQRKTLRTKAMHTPSLQPDSTHFFSCSNVCLSVRHYYNSNTFFLSVCLYAIITAGNITCTMNTSRHFGFECTLVMQWCRFFICQSSFNIFDVVSNSIYLCKYWATCIN